MSLCSAFSSLSLGFGAHVGSVEGLRAAPAAAAPAHVATTCEVRVRRLQAASAGAPADGAQIRFTRLGRNKSPFYRVVVMDSRTRRDGRPLEYLGWYNPLKHETQLDAPAIKKWLDVGAKASTSVENLLKKALIVPAGEKKVYKQMSTKDATAAKNARAAAVKKAAAAAAAKVKAAADKKKAELKAAADAAKAAAAAAAA